MRAGWAWGLVAVAMAAGCSSETVVEVTLHAEPAMADRLARLELAADGRRPGEAWEPREGGDVVVLEGAELSWPVRYRYTARREVEGREYRVTARPYDLAGNQVTILRVVGRYREGETHRHELRFDDACLFVLCAGAEETCQSGRCRDARDATWDLDASTEPPPPPPRLDAGDDAAPDAASDAGTDAATDAAPTDAGEDAVSDAGTDATAESDAGGTDAGTDAGSDAAAMGG